MKKIILRLLPWLIALAALACLIIFVFVPIYTQVDNTDLPEPEIIFGESDGKPITMENDALLFEMDSATSQFKVTEKATGRVYLSNPTDAANDPIAIRANKDMMQATAVLAYTNSAGTTEMDNFTYSIANQNFTIEQPAENEISVKYAIGKIERVYLIPTAITKDRYDAFRANVKKSTQKKIASNYSLYEPEKLDSKKNKDEVIALYPEVLNQPLYILNPDTKSNNKAKLEEYFAEAGYTQEDFDIDQQLVAGSRDSSGAVFNITMNYRLEGNDLIVDVPYSEIRYKADYPITSLTVLPMFGATTTDQDGFIFVPEGGGALINYNNGKLKQNAYYANVYGWNYSTYRNEVVNETRTAFPVFGMTNEGSSFLCLMEGATSYASIQADISMRNNSYNWARAKYTTLHYDQYQVSMRTSSLVFMYEKCLPNDTIIHRYRFLPTDSYVEMAKAYGDYLRENDLLKEAKASEDVPVSVEMLGAIDKTQVKFGVPVNTIAATTTFAQAEEMLLDLNNNGIANLNVRMSGWANGGIEQKVMTSVRVLRQLGGKDAMAKLIATAKANDVPLYFDAINCFAYNSGILQGFNGFTDAARLATREQVKIYPYDWVTFLSDDFYDPYYLVKPRYAKSNTDNLINHLKEAGAAGVSFRDIGYLLSGDYNPKDTVTREEVKQLNIQSMLDAEAAGQRVMIRAGNDYALPYADIITDMDLLGTKYSILNETVPFYQIAIHGLKDYTGESLNTSGDYIQEFLRCVEYGSGLNFTFMAEDAKILQDTYHSTYFGANYDVWRDTALEMITKYQAETKGLNQQRIVDHARLSKDVSVTTYEDGTKVYVNHGDTQYQDSGITLDAYSYSVERGN